MPTSSSMHVFPANDAYRRQARRVRARWAGNPSKMHLILGELARRRDDSSPPASRPIDRTIAFAPTRASHSREPWVAAISPKAHPDRPVAGMSVDSAERFSAMVGSCLEGPILRHARREALFRAGRRMGLSRFDANLLIAAVQHHAPQIVLDESLEQPRRMWPAVGVGIVVAIEIMFALTMWWMIAAR